MMSTYAVPDQANFDFGDNPVPDNFLDQTMENAYTKHSRKESQMASVQEEFAKHIDKDTASNIASNLINNANKETPGNEITNNTASNIASHLIGDENDEVPVIPENFLDQTMLTAMTQHSRKESQTNSLQNDFAKLMGQNAASNIAESMMSFLHDGTNESSANTTPRNTQNVALDPDEDDERLGDDMEEAEDDDAYGLDEMLTEAVTAHKHRESRTDFVESKLHELFDENDENLKAMTGTKGGGDDDNGVQDMSAIASNLIAFLHNDPVPNENEKENASQNVLDTSKRKARGSTDLSDLQSEIDGLHSKVNGLENDLKIKNDENMELNERVNELEEKNHLLMKEIEFLQNSKTNLALQSNKSIDQMRKLLMQYQECMKLKQ